MSNSILNLSVNLPEYGTPSTVIILDAIPVGWVVSELPPSVTVAVSTFVLAAIFLVALVVLPQLSSTVYVNIAEFSVFSWTCTIILELSIVPSWSSVTFTPEITSISGFSTSSNSVNPSNTGASLYTVFRLVSVISNLTLSI